MGHGHPLHTLLRAHAVRAVYLFHRGPTDVPPNPPVCRALCSQTLDRHPLTETCHPPPHAGRLKTRGLRRIARLGHDSATRKPRSPHTTGPSLSNSRTHGPPSEITPQNIPAVPKSVSRASAGRCRALDLRFRSPSGGSPRSTCISPSSVCACSRNHTKSHSPCTETLATVPPQSTKAGPCGPCGGKPAGPPSQQHSGPQRAHPSPLPAQMGSSPNEGVKLF